MPYSFTAEIVRVKDTNTTVVHVPNELIEQLPMQGKKLRVEGYINGAEFEGAFLSAKTHFYLMVSKRLLKRSGLAVGEFAHLEFEVADQDAVRLPQELQFALDANETAKTVWESWTPGKRRSYCHRIRSAKRAETKEKRIEELFEELLFQH